jgi:hypothetical protein
VEVIENSALVLGGKRGLQTLGPFVEVRNCSVRIEGRCTIGEVLFRNSSIHAARLLRDERLGTVVFDQCVISGSFLGCMFFPTFERVMDPAFVASFRNCNLSQASLHLCDLPKDCALTNSLPAWPSFFINEPRRYFQEFQALDDSLGWIRRQFWGDGSQIRDSMMGFNAAREVRDSQELDKLRERLRQLPGVIIV